MFQKVRPNSPAGNVRTGLLALFPPPVSTTSITPGLHHMTVDDARDTLLYIPESITDPVPLVILLHGAGGEARRSIELLREQADVRGFAILAPASRGATWDVIEGGFGPDVEALNRTLAQTMAGLNVSPKQIAVGGFSDGASYALTLGVSNGGQFSAVLAFSAGFMVPSEYNGKPRIFLSHGTRDSVLPIDRCGRPLAQKLRKLRYEVDYREFDGPHTVPKEMREAAVRWWLGPPAASRP